MFMHRITGSAAVTVLLAGLSAGAQPASRQTLPPADAALMTKALAAYDAGDFGAAEPVLGTLAVRHPENYVVNESLGSLYSEAGQVSRAVPYLERAVRVSPGEALGHANLGATYLKLKQMEKAVAELRVAAKLDPRNFETLSNLGQAWMQSNQPASAAQTFAAAEKLRPYDPDTLYNWALALQAEKSPGEAAAVLGRIPAAARTGETESLAGELAEQLGDYKAAVVAYQAAARLEPSANNIYGLALELLRHWTWEEALTVARFGQSRFPDDQRFSTAAGIALYADGKYPEAAAEFSSLLRLNPENATYADLLGRSCEASGEDTVGTACQALDAFASAHPGNARIAVFVAAHILHSPVDQQDTARAEALVKQAIAADPQMPEAYFQLAVLEQQRAHWKESAAPLEKAIILRPEYTEAHFRLSRAYAHLGRRDEALHEIALQQQYSKVEKDHLNSRMHEMVRFMLIPAETKP